jgi:hypothetical protein
MASGKSRIDVRKLRARCRHFRFASRRLDDWRRLGHPQPPRWPTRRSSISIWRRAVEVEVSPCRVCVFGPSVDSTTCQHDGGDDENAGHRSGVCVGERREIGVAHAAVAWGKKAAMQARDTLLGEEMERSPPKRESHHYQRLPETSIQRPAHLRSPNSRSETRGDSHPSADHRVRFSSRKLHFSTGSLRFHV